MTEEAQEEAQSSTGSSSSTIAAPQGRSIFSYFGNGSSAAGPSRPPPPVQPAKKRRKKDEEVGSQARLKANGEAGWMLGKHGEAPGASGEEGTNGVAPDDAKAPTKRSGARAKDDGEEAETREMKRKMREAVAMERKGKRKSKEVVAPEGNVVMTDAGSNHAKGRRRKVVENTAVPPESAANGSLAPASQSSNSSPAKRAPRGPRYSTTASRASQSRDASEPIDLSQHPSSDPPDQPGPSVLVHRASSPSEIVITGHLKSDKPGHPFFSRTNSAMSTSTNKGASQQDPIDIDVEPPPAALANSKVPKRTFFASDSKPAHSFFARVINGDANGTRASSVLSETAPTETSITTNKSSKEKGKGKVHSFFKPNGHVQLPGTTNEGWGRGVKDGDGWAAPWPGQLLPSHEPSWTFHSESAVDLPRRKAVPPATLGVDDFFGIATESFRSDLPLCSSPATSPPAIHTSPEIDKHPAIASLPSRGTSDKREMWTEHYRPRRACEVLGNEIEATYLRDWLSALAVGSKDGTYPKVVRKIKKIPYKPQSFDGWLVDDIGLFGDIAEEEEEEELDFVEIEEAPLPFHKRPAAYPDFKGRLANAILLIGPPGTGKSAAIHAVTTELGWDVFEVYPGIGKRTATNLFSLVGDVGRNHMVVKSKEDCRSNGKNFFGAKQTSPSKLKAPNLGSQEEPIDLGGYGQEDEEEIVGEESKFRQSVILLDEVDLLFDEENTFWGAARQLIAESKRPLILTCNETIPLATLPLQAILDFRAPPRSLAAAYLSAIAKQENVTEVETPALLAQCTSCGPVLVDQPLPPNGHEPMPVLDLRKAISQLQLDRAPLRDVSSAHNETQGDDLGSRCAQLEARSFADAMIAPRDWARLDDSEVDRLAPGPDDLLDFDLIVKPELADSVPVIPAYASSRHLGNYLQQLSGGPLPVDDLLPVQTRFIRSLLPVLDPLIPLSAHLLPHSSLFLDHLSVIRSMVRTDDMMEEAEEAILAEGGERINRKTGRPMRSGAGGAFQRYLYQLSREACQAALDSELIFA